MAADFTTSSDVFRIAELSNWTNADSKVHGSIVSNTVRREGISLTVTYDVQDGTIIAASRAVLGQPRVAVFPAGGQNFAETLVDILRDRSPKDAPVRYSYFRVPGRGAASRITVTATDGSGELLVRSRGGEWIVETKGDRLVRPSLREIKVLAEGLTLDEATAFAENSLLGL